MSDVISINLKVLLLDTDFYALDAINAYLAWDRRTRVIHMAESIESMWDFIANSPLAELPNVVVMDADHIGGPEGLKATIARLQESISDVMIVCLAQFINPELVEAAAEAHARAFLQKKEVRLHIAWAIVYAATRDFVISPGIARACAHLFYTRIFHATILPERREYPELTERIRQAIKLCVVEGMPAHLAADEMGISLHTIRGYIKEGYRILEAYDHNEYPVDMTPQERAFMRFTALADDTPDEEP
jgi:DNA-binding NarL/FixJ family response regulator